MAFPDAAGGSVAGRAPGLHHAGGRSGVGGYRQRARAATGLFKRIRIKPVTCSRVQEPFTTGYYVTGIHTRMQVLMLRLRVFIEDIPRVPEAKYR